MFGDNDDIKLWRKNTVLEGKKELNQTELGKRIHMTQRKVSYIECGKYEPSIDDIKSFCKFFQVSADYLIGNKKGLDYPDR